MTFRPKFRPKFRQAWLLPLLILVSFLTFAVRMGDFISGLQAGGTAYAETGGQAEPAPAKNATPPAAGLTAAPAAAAPAAPKLDSVADADGDDADVKEALYKDLAKRRADLDKREKDLAAREALLQAGEKEVDQKLQQLTQVRNEIQALMKQQSDVEQARIDSLVKVYEGMKPEDAARIFDTLDMDLLVKLMGGMSERKSGPILAAMNPERARQVTQLLAQQKQLPEVPPQ